MNLGEVEEVIFHGINLMRDATTMVTNLCMGTQKWTMSVPARPEHDPDIVISRALRHETLMVGTLRSMMVELYEKQLSVEFGDCPKHKMRVIESFRHHPVDPKFMVIRWCTECGSVSRSVEDGDPRADRLVLEETDPKIASHKPRFMVYRRKEVL